MNHDDLMDALDDLETRANDRDEFMSALEMKLDAMREEERD